MEAAVNKPIANALLCSDGAFYLVGARHNEEKSSLFPVPLTEELQMITSILRNWADVDASLRVARKYGGSGWIPFQRRHCQHGYRRVPLRDCNGDEWQECHKWASIHRETLPREPLGG
ncbi:trans-sialidase [Trypanosoma cruzi]|nr:trans-sialidase [Trypanosoma cruzi]